MTSLPRFTHILELCLYARSLPTSVAWYKDVLRLTPHLDTPRVAAFTLGDTATLLLFQRGETSADVSLGDAGLIPGHGLPPSSDVTLKTHFALAVETPEEVAAWRDELERKGTKILGEVSWPKGGKSVYFADPDEHVGEIASRGIWPNY
ncbi:glyoxalase/bleomycin resistance protein/dioxygenase [Leucosporidium creatinivorum]|uniref:Glyoxalase/bleomycin resistance protein/dioxygenase n=1 Tax=Leucosporidium creatinivorum TaxID=106004 RepID=A0A1Y2F8R1_9BASI|nr:glyoxalase/bleomycin resistance protein/dioxygenase [Leucosporidium creatinivorum]